MANDGRDDNDVVHALRDMIRRGVWDTMNVLKMDCALTLLSSMVGVFRRFAMALANWIVVSEGREER